MASLSDILNGSSGTPSTQQRGSGPSRSQRSVSPQSSRPRQADNDDDGGRTRVPIEEAAEALRNTPTSNPDTERKGFTIGKAFKEVGNAFTGTALGITELAKAAGHTVLNTPVMAIDATIGLAEAATGRDLPGGWDKNEDGSNKSLGDYYRPSLDMAYGLAMEVPKMGRRAVAYAPEISDHIIPGLGLVREVGDTLGINVPGATGILEGDLGLVSDDIVKKNQYINQQVREEFTEAWNNDRALELVAGDVGLIAAGAGMAAGSARIASAVARGSQGAKAAQAAGAARYGVGSRTFNWATRNKGKNRGPRANNFASRADRIADRLDNFSYKADGYDPSIAAWRVVSKYTKRARTNRGRKSQSFDADGNTIKKQTLGNKMQTVAARYRDAYMRHDFQNKLMNEKAKYEETATKPTQTLKDHFNNADGPPMTDNLARVVTNLTAGTLQSWIETYESARKRKGFDEKAHIEGLLSRFNDGPEGIISEENPQTSVRAQEGSEIEDTTKLTFEDIKNAADYMGGRLPEQELLAVNSAIEALARQGETTAQKLVNSNRLDADELQKPYLANDGEEVRGSLSDKAKHSLLYETNKIPAEAARLSDQIDKSRHEQQRLKLDLEFIERHLVEFSDIDERTNHTRLKENQQKIADLDRQIAIDTEQLELYEGLASDYDYFNDPVRKATNAALGPDSSPGGVDNLIDELYPLKRGELLDEWKELGDIKFVGTFIDKILEIRHSTAKNYLVERLGTIFTQPVAGPDGGLYFAIPWIDEGVTPRPAPFEEAWETDPKFMARMEDWDTPQGRELMTLIMEEQGVAPQKIAEFLNQDNLRQFIYVDDLTDRVFDQDVNPELSDETRFEVEIFNQAHIEWRESAPDGTNGFHQPELLLDRGVQSLFDAANRGTRKIGEDNASFGDLYMDKEFINLMAQSIDLPIETIEKFLQHIADPRGDGPLSVEINKSVGEIRDRIIEDLGDRDPATGMWDVSYDDVNQRLHEAIHAEFSSQGLAGVTDALDDFMQANPEAATAWVHADSAADAMLAVTDADGRLFGMEKDAVLGEDQVAALIRRRAYLDEFLYAVGETQPKTNALNTMLENFEGEASKFSRINVDPNAPVESAPASWVDVDGEPHSIGEDGTMSDPYANVAFFDAESIAAIQRQIDAGGDFVDPESGRVNDLFGGEGSENPLQLRGRDENGVEYSIDASLKEPGTGSIPVEWSEGRGQLDEFGEIIDQPGFEYTEPYINIGKEIARVDPRPPETRGSVKSDYLPSMYSMAEKWNELGEYLGDEFQTDAKAYQDKIAEQEYIKHETGKDIAYAQQVNEMYERYERKGGGTTSALQELEAEISVKQKELRDLQADERQQLPLYNTLKGLVDAPEEMLNRPLSVTMANHLKGQTEVIRKIVNQWGNEDTASKAIGTENPAIKPNAGKVEYIEPSRSVIERSEMGQRPRIDVSGKGKIQIEKGSVIEKILDDIDAQLEEQFAAGVFGSVKPSEKIKARLVWKVERKQIDLAQEYAIDDFLGQGTPMQRELFRIMEREGFWELIPESMRADLIINLVKQDLNNYIKDAQIAGSMDMGTKPLAAAEGSFTMMLDLQQRITTQVQRAIDQPEIDKLNGSPLMDDAFRRSQAPAIREVSVQLGQDLLNDLDEQFVKAFAQTIQYLDGDLYKDFDLQKLRMQYMPRNYRVIAKNSVELIKTQLATMRANNVELAKSNTRAYSLRKTIAATTDPAKKRDYIEQLRQTDMNKDRLIMENEQLQSQLLSTPGDLRMILQQNQDPNSLFNTANKRVDLNGVPYVRTGEGAREPGRSINTATTRAIKVGEVDAERSAGRGIVTPDFENHQRMEMAQAHEMMRSEMVRVLVNDKKFDGYFSWDPMKIPLVAQLFEGGRKPTLTAIGNAAAESGWQLVAQPRGDLGGASNKTHTDPWRMFEEATAGDQLWNSPVNDSDLSTMKVIRKEVAEVIQSELESSKISRVGMGFDALTTMWKFTVLPIRAMWLINNVFGNLSMAVLSSGNRMNSLSEIAGAMKKVLDSEVDALNDTLGVDNKTRWDALKNITKNDGAISTAPRRLNQTNYSLSEYQGINGGNQNPEMGLQRGAALMSDPDYVKQRRESTIQAQADIADLETQLQDPSLTPAKRKSLENELAIAHDVIGIGNARSKVMQGTATAVRTGYRINATVDSMFRAAVYQLEFDRGMNEVGQGYRKDNGLPSTTPLHARQQGTVNRSISEVQEKAINNTLKALGDFTRLTKIEKTFIKRAIPFYPWLRHQITMTMRLPISNPARAGLLMKIYDIMVDEDEQNPEWAAAFGNSIQTPWGRTNALRGANPFESPLNNPLSPLSNSFGSAINPIPKMALETFLPLDIGAGNRQSRPDQQPMLTPWLQSSSTSAFGRLKEGDFKGGLGELGFKLSGMTGQTALLRDAALTRFEGTGSRGVGKRNFTDGSFDSGDIRPGNNINTTALNKVASGLGLPQLPFDQSTYEQQVRKQAIQNKRRRDRQES